MQNTGVRDFRHIKLVIAYEGTRYKGWQKQDNELTVQGVIEETLRDVIGKKVSVRGASRTDAGVHAEGQVACFKVENCPIPTESFVRILNDRLPEDIAVRSSEQVDAEFHPSKDALYKRYVYRIYTGRDKDVKLFRRRWGIGYDLDIEEMNKAANYLIGTHNYIGFASARDERDNTVRTVMLAKFQRAKCQEDEIIFTIQADRFLQYMVRNIVGSLVEIGRGHWPAERIGRIIASRDRRQAGPTAPPCGLCLDEIVYING